MEVNTAFGQWFELEYPANPDGNRPKYKEAQVMDLMKSSWRAGQQNLAMSSLGHEDLASLQRFKKTNHDDNPIEIPVNALDKLLEIGVVRMLGFGRYSTTILGDWILLSQPDQDGPSPLFTNNY